MRVYQTTALVWLTLALASVFLPESARMEWWIPLHLALLGAVSVAISGAMQNFSSVLTATPAPPTPMVRSQYALVNAGAALIIVGHASHTRSVVGVGGACFLIAILLLGWMVVRAHRRAMHLRHRTPLLMYEAAVACLILGAAVGVRLALLKGEDARGLEAHMVLNVLGFATITIAGSLVTMLPTVLRVQMPAWRGRLTTGLLLAGVIVLAAGALSGHGFIVLPGSLLFAAGVGGLLEMVRRVAKVPRKWRVPVSAKHLALAICWLVIGSIVLVAWRPAASRFLDFDATFELVFVCGWILQVLLGVWMYLLPMIRPGHPDERRRQLSAIEWGAAFELATVNVGLLLVFVSGFGDFGQVLPRAGAALALVGTAFMLVKAWTFPWLGRVEFFSRRSLAVWDPNAPDAPAA
jgi:nitrite reductase (NO-forming)